MTSSTPSTQRPVVHNLHAWLWKAWKFSSRADFIHRLGVTTVDNASGTQYSRTEFQYGDIRIRAREERDMSADAGPASGDNSRIQARLANHLAEWLDGRAERMHGGGRNQQAITELGLWRMALDAELRKIRLTVPQAACIADVLDGTLLPASIAGSLPLVYAECASAFDIVRDTPIPGGNAYGATWNIDEQELLAYLRRLSPVADHALADAIARWREHNLDATVDGFAQVGLRVVDVEPAPGP
jgi:hypothetical protein